MRAVPRALILAILGVFGALVTLARPAWGRVEVAWIAATVVFLLYLHSQRAHMSWRLGLAAALSVGTARAVGAAQVLPAIGAAIVVDETVRRLGVQYVESGISIVRPTNTRNLRIASASGAVIGCVLHVLSGGPAWARDALGWSLGISIFVVLTAHVFRLRDTHLALGAGPRIAAHFVLGALAFTGGATAATLAGAEGIAPFNVGLATFGVAAWSTTLLSELGCSRALRTLAAITTTIAPVALVLFVLAMASVMSEIRLAILFALFAMVAGSATRRVAKLFLPEGGRLQAALHEALRETHRSAEVGRFRQMLESLAYSRGTLFAAPDLYRAEPACKHEIDRAGYERVHAAVWPDAVFLQAVREPYGLLRKDVLEATCVRQPEVRPALAWMERERVSIAIAVGLDPAAGEQGSPPPGALLTFPDLGFSEFSLEEALVASDLARALRAVIDARGAIERAQERTELLRARTLELDAALDRERAERSLGSTRLASTVQSLTLGATSGSRSAEMIQFVEVLARRFSADRAVVIRRSPGANVIHLLARAHLASPRSEGSLVVVDGTSPSFHRLELWSDPVRSPVNAAHRGRLVLCDPFALPADVRAAIEETLRERRGPGLASALDVAVTFVVAQAPVIDEEDNAFVARFAQAFEDPLTLPSLAARPHDIEGLLRESIAREGMRQKGHAVGLSDGALAVAIEHPFLGGDAELSVVAVRAVNLSRGELVHAVDMRSALGAPAPTASGAPPPLLREVEPVLPAPAVAANVSPRRGRRGRSR